MNINQFISENIYEDIKSKVAQKAAFDFKQNVKENGYNICLSIKGDSINQDLADRNWKGRNYLVYFDATLTGHEKYTGTGFAKADFETIDGYQDFKVFIEKILSMFQIFKKTEEEIQMCMF